MNIKLIAATDKNRGIGLNGTIPWSLPLDMKHFKETTKGHVVVMGRKTYESIPEKYRPLPGRTNVVLSKSLVEGDLPGCSIFNGFHEVINFYARKEVDTIYVAGGGQIYEEAIGYASEVILTEIDESFPADTFFPFGLVSWIGRSMEFFPKSESNPYSFRIMRYTRPPSHHLYRG